MNGTPAFCPNCNNVVLAHSIISGGSIKFSVSGSKITCPQCRGIASILDGEYNVINGSFELLNGPHSTVENLQKLRKIFEKARTEGLSSEEIGILIDKDAPAYSAFKKFLPQNAADLNGYINSLLLLITLILGTYLTNEGLKIARLTYADGKADKTHIESTSKNDNFGNEVSQPKREGVMRKHENFRSKTSFKDTDRANEFAHLKEMDIRISLNQELNEPIEDFINMTFKMTFPNATLTKIESTSNFDYNLNFNNHFMTIWAFEGRLIHLEKFVTDIEVLKYEMQPQ